MNRLFFVIICLFITCYSIYSENNYESGDVEFIIDESDTDNEEPVIIENPNKNHRIPPRQKRCSISFASKEVTVTPALSEEIIRYEIWDADNAYCLSITSEAEDFCNQLRMFNQVVIIKLVTETRTYKGYIHL